MIMASDDNDSKWGTIFLDSTRESTLSKLDAMQAASRQEQWNQRTQQDYLEKVRAKAVERARTILGEAYTERQKIIEEAEADAANIRQEAKLIQASAEGIRNEAQELKHSVQAELDRAKHTHSSAQEDGFQAGLEQAQEELEKFRHTMGSSVAGVLKAIEEQSLNIFAHWRLELVNLLKVCVEKGTGLALDERYNKILEQLVIEAVRNLDDRRHVNLRVHPDDEPVMADIFSAAKEKMPDLGQWAITADPSLELGGLVAESKSGTVDSRLELFREMVDNILEHLALPESNIDAAGVAFAQKISQLEMENIAHLVPAEPIVQVADEDEGELENADTLTAEPEIPQVQDEMIQSLSQDIEQKTAQDTDADSNQESMSQVVEDTDVHTPTDTSSVPPLAPKSEPVVNTQNVSEQIDTNIQSDEENIDKLLIEEMPQDQNLSEPADMPKSQEPNKQEPSREELEEELLPLPQDTEYATQVNDDTDDILDELDLSESKDSI